MSSKRVTDLLSVAVTLIDKGRSREAIDTLTQVLDDHNTTRSQMLTGLLLRGAAWLKTENISNAESDWRAVLTIDPKNMHAIKRLKSLIPTHHHSSTSGSPAAPETNLVAQQSIFQTDPKSPPLTRTSDSLPASDPTSVAGSSSSKVNYIGRTMTQRPINLPYEIWLTIAEFLPATCHRPWLGVSCTHRAIAIPLIFKDVRLAFCREETTSNVMSTQTKREIDTKKQIYRSKGILDRIISDPGFAMSVKSLTILATKTTAGLELCSQLVKALPHMVSLVSFTWKLGYMELPDDVALALAVNVPSLRHLSICGADFTTNNLLALRNLSSLSIYSYLGTAQFHDTIAKIFDFNKTTLRRLTFAPEFLLLKDSDTSGEERNLLPNSTINQLQHLTIHTLHPPLIHSALMYGHNLLSLTIHLRKITFFPSFIFTSYNSTGDLPNLRDFVFIISDPNFHAWHDPSALPSVMRFITTSAPNLERLWLGLQTSSIVVNSAVSKELWDLPKLRALKINFMLRGVTILDKLVDLSKAFPSTLEAIFIKGNLDYCPAIMAGLMDENDSGCRMPSLKYMIFDDYVPHDLPRIMSVAWSVIRWHSELEVVGVRSTLFDVTRNGEDRQTIELIPVTDIPMRKIHGEDEDRELNSLEWVWRDVN